MRTPAIKALVTMALGLTAVAASAATTTTTFSVSTTVNATCVINSASALTFAAFDPSQGAQASTSSISVNCTNTTPFNIGLNAGTGTGATVASRVMTSGANTLTYSLYQDSGHASVWGNTVGTNTVAGTGAGMAAGNAITKTVYGLIPSQPNTVPGNYADTVTVTVTY
ncbi:Csu type fimbrial protein [Ralstonia pseudosolanacearum]|uniref:Sigma-fimbriae tip adhesin n=2 Tax=Ralstonia solanacearum species complex TaxID=3116862 RepID=A0A0S4U1Z2_RALSL|nr:spore coat U domain-containing protein [Ralstonia pseudosolanacearum]AUS43257.1 spore coat protein [Ralstonia solanacearum]ASL74027.1 spore coat protein [Ralstonia pseudosolanacearum]AST85620.1 spore coat protein [Ralstonia pseudosolanacearum]AYA45681.1 spore coat protein [Ralstonia pseudosolanacearum]KAF3463021.1 spore coat protein U [Ralstonia solanacearum]